jgi:hypothetical protein
MRKHQPARPTRYDGELHMHLLPFLTTHQLFDVRFCVHNVWASRIPDAESSTIHVSMHVDAFP